MMVAPATPAYTLESLQALQELLQSHRGLLWAEPTSHSLAVKPSTQPLKEEEAEPNTAWQ